VAEICSWYSVLTTSNLGHVIEESLWGLSALLAVIAMAAFHPHCPGRWRPALLTGVLAGVPYTAYMFLIDVPEASKERAGQHGIVAQRSRASARFRLNATQSASAP
jgi:hypothetical protein